MANENPRIVTSLEWARLFVTGLMFVQALIVWPHNHLFAIAFITAGLAIGIVQVRILSTKLTPKGASQFTWRGRVQLRWDEIKTVTRNLRSITEAGSGGSVIVPLESYYDTQAALLFLKSHLPTHLREVE